MLSVILEFDVIEGKTEEFISCWDKCTKVIYENFGSLGSRLHKQNNNKFIAYAQWPDVATYEKSGEWPGEFIQYRNDLRSLLKSGKPTILYKLDVEIDFLQANIFKEDL